jgi:hypothetical protein
LLAPPAPTLRLAVERAACNSGLGAAHVLAAPSSSVRDAVLRVAARGLEAALLLAPFASAMRLAVGRAACRSPLQAAFKQRSYGAPTHAVLQVPAHPSACPSRIQPSYAVSHPADTRHRALGGNTTWCPPERDVLNSAFLARSFPHLRRLPSLCRGSKPFLSTVQVGVTAVHGEPPHPPTPTDVPRGFSQ